MELTDLVDREIPEEVAARTDKDNEFPMDMWGKLGQAGYQSIKDHQEIY